MVEKIDVINKMYKISSLIFGYDQSQILIQNKLLVSPECTKSKLILLDSKEPSCGNHVHTPYHHNQKIEASLKSEPWIQPL